jgi:hypothetical protein
MNLKDLTKLIALCRKTGVASIKMEGIELVLGTEPIKYARKAEKSAQIDYQQAFDPGPVPTPLPWAKEFPEAGLPAPQIEHIPTDTLSEEDLLFYSAGGNQ